MLTETTFKLPDNLVARAQQYAHEHHTTLTAIIRKHLDTVIAAKNDPLIEFSQGDMTKEEAISALGVFQASCRLNVNFYAASFSS